MRKCIPDGWVKIGEVGVDSGQLIVCDPCYIDSSWEKKDFVGNQKIRIKKTGKVVEGPDNWETKFDGKMTWNEAMKQGLIEELPWEKTGEFNYDGCCRETLSEQGGQLGLGTGVVFSTGMGDGTYEVWAKMDGGRVQQIKIKFF